LCGRDALAGRIFGMSDEGLVAGIDLGGTKILTLVFDAEHRVVGRDQRATEDEDGGPEAVMQRMAASVREAAASRTLSGVGISAAGPVDLKRGVVTTPPNLEGWHDVPLQAGLTQLLGQPCTLAHDADCGAVAEHRLGAGIGAENLIYVTLGTGVGGGLILAGKLYTGTSGSAGEIGHMLVEPAGRVCNCGRRGCLEAMTAGAYLGMDAAAIVQAEPSGVLARLCEERGEEPDARLLSEAADAGDASADAAIRRAGAYLGVGLANLVNVFNPEVIVLGGSLLALGERYFGPAREVMQRDAFAQPLRDLRLVDALLGSDAPAIGAALIARDRISGA
jgi:glucokinase